MTDAQGSLRGTGPLTEGVIGTIEKQEGDRIWVTVTDPGDTAYEMGQRLGDFKERWEEI